MSLSRRRSAAFGTSAQSGTGWGSGNTVPVPAPGLLFWDDFSSGNFSKTMNGCSWGGATNVSVQSGFSSVGNTGHAAKFNFDIALNGVSELRYDLGSDRPELWVGMRLYMPSGSESPSVGPRLDYPDPGLSGQSGRNKLFRCWSKARINSRISYPNVGAQWQPAALTSGTAIASGDAGLVPSAGIYPNDGGSVSQLDTDSRPFLTDATRGRWVTLEMYAKAATGSGTNDGIVRWWLDGTLLTESTGLNMYETPGAGFGEGYIMGAIDRQFSNAGSCVYLDYFGVSTSGRVFASPFFTDSFAGLQKNNANGVLWNPSPAGDVSVVSFDGYNCLRFRYGGQSTAEQRFDIGKYTQVFGMEFWIHIPSNFSMRNPTLGNKFWQVWRDVYSDFAGGTQQAGMEYWIVGGVERPAATGRGMLRMADPADPSFGYVTDIAGDAANQTPLIGTTGPLVIGAWNRVRMMVSGSSAFGVADGFYKVWFNNTLYINVLNHRIHNVTASPSDVRFRNGYLMGYTNTGFTNQTDFHIRDVKFYDANPGW